MWILGWPLVIHQDGSDISGPGFGEKSLAERLPSARHQNIHNGVLLSKVTRIVDETLQEVGVIVIACQTNKPCEIVETAQAKEQSKTQSVKENDNHIAQLGGERLWKPIVR